MHLASESPYALAKLGHGYAVAMVHVGLKENDAAFDWLGKALEQRSLWLGYLSVEPQFDGLRSDPRFQDLLRRVGLRN